jgi:hypothetical protein
MMIWSWKILIFLFEFFSENQEDSVPTYKETKRNNQINDKVTVKPKPSSMH